MRPTPCSMLTTLMKQIYFQTRPSQHIWLVFIATWFNYLKWKMNSRDGVCNTHPTPNETIQSHPTELRDRSQHNKSSRWYLVNFQRFDMVQINHFSKSEHWTASLWGVTDDVLCVKSDGDAKMFRCWPCISRSEEQQHWAIQIFWQTLSILTSHLPDHLNPALAMFLDIHTNELKYRITRISGPDGPLNLVTYAFSWHTNKWAEMIWCDIHLYTQKNLV